MEKDNYCKKCSWSICRCETEEPLSSHAVLAKVPTLEQCEELALQILKLTKDGAIHKSVENTYNLIIISIREWYYRHFA